MAQVQKIDSNITGLAYAEEQRLGVLGGSPVWNRLEPNSYSDFGGEVVTVAPNPINPSRQRRKGVTTDLNASGGFNHNLTFQNLTDLMQGVMFADIRRKGRMVPTAVTATLFAGTAPAGVVAGSLVKGVGFGNTGNNRLFAVTGTTGGLEVTGASAEAAPPAAARVDLVGHELTSGEISVVVPGSDLPYILFDSIDPTTFGIVPGQWIYIGGDSGTGLSQSANNGFKRVRNVLSDRIIIDKSYLEMVTEGASANAVRIFFGDVLRNETGSLIKRRTYHVERLLGAPDDAAPGQIQSEVLKGAAANEFTLNIPSAELVNVDFSFIATDNEQRTGVQGPLQTNVVSALAAKEYNTSSDVGRIRLSTISQSETAPAALFAYVTEATISINNNVTANKAVGVLGAFDVTAGTFTVSGDLTAYFSSVAATQAVRNNADVTLDISFVKDNTGLVYDLPLVSLGDGRLNVEVDQPITLPLSTDAASGQDVAQVLDHTLLITYFNYLPNSAM